MPRRASWGRSHRNGLRLPLLNPHMSREFGLDVCETAPRACFLQELGEGPAAQPAAGEDALKRRCIVMLELSATMARVLEFVTARLARAFLEGPPLNMARLAETACFVVAHLAAPTAAARAICAVLSSRFPAAQNAKRAVLLAPVLGALLKMSVEPRRRWCPAFAPYVCGGEHSARSGAPSPRSKVPTPPCLCAKVRSRQMGSAVW